MFKKIFAVAFFSLVFAHAGLAVDPPRVTVTQLFADLIGDDEFEGWKVTGISEIQHWTQDHAERRKALTDHAEIPVLVHPLTVKPVLLNGQSADFFIGVPPNFARDGTWMGYKYAFLPESILPAALADKSSPLFFFLLRHVPAGAGPQSFDTPNQNEIDEKLSEISLSYYCGHEALVHHKANQPGWCRVLIKKGAEHGDARALALYAQSLKNGIGGPADPVQARVYFKRAADQGYAKAQHSYALMATNGAGGPKDLVEARVYFKRAADQGHAKGQYNYGVMAANGEGGPKDLVEARAYFKRAADQGYANAQYNYALMAAKGEGGPKDLVEARVYFKRAADQGHANAQYNYGSMAAKGEGGPKNFVEARTYSKRAADQGHSEAQFNYAFMAGKGEGGPKDLVEARDYFKRAADQGHDLGEFYYAAMLEEGVGGQVDLANARIYYERAAANGNEKAKQALERLNAGAEPVGKKHKPEQK